MARGEPDGNHRRMIDGRRAPALSTLLAALVATSTARADEPVTEPPLGEGDAESTAPAEPAPAPPPAAPAPPPAAPARRVAVATEDDEPAHGNEPPTRRHRWYGWQTLISDGVALSIVIAGSTATSDRGFLNALIGGAVVFVAIPPIIHFAHERPVAAIGSLLLRGLPVLLLSQVGDCTGGTYMCPEAALVLAGVGLVPAMIAVDAAVLAREPAPSRRAFLDGTSLRVSLRREGGFDVGIGGAL
jgi:hypothetical protein